MQLRNRKASYLLTQGQKKVSINVYSNQSGTQRNSKIQIIFNYYIFSRRREAAFKAYNIRDVMDDTNFNTPRNLSHCPHRSQLHNSALNELSNEPTRQQHAQLSPSSPPHYPSTPIIADPPPYQRPLTPPYQAPPSPIPSPSSLSRCSRLPNQQQSCPNCNTSCSGHMFEPPPPYQE